jgi:2-isopropylmalate synthase
MLVRIGYKEIDIAFPSASQTEFDFCRHLVEIPAAVPSDVWLQVLSPCRKELIRRTVDSVTGCKQAILSLYIATSISFVTTIFNSTQAEILEKAVDCVKYARSITKDDPKQAGTKWSLMFSPEAFTDTDVKFSIEICEAVKEAWGPDIDNKIILNLPATVEMGGPNTYADQVELFTSSLTQPELCCVSLHPHNDRGCAIAAAELGQLAGAERVEGCLFGNGERTGNVDLVTLALNLYVQGVDPKLDFSDINSIKEVYEECTMIPIPPRAPYSGDSAFKAYSGSHQDAINKAFKTMDQNGLWKVPYLPLDPQDIGSNYKAVIQVNSQSGKGGVAWTLRQALKIDLPRGMQIEFSKIVKTTSVAQGGVLPPDQLSNLFIETYHLFSSDLNVKSVEIITADTSPSFKATVCIQGQQRQLRGRGDTIAAAVIDTLSMLNQDIAFTSSATSLIYQDVSYKVILVRAELIGTNTSSWGASIVRMGNVELAELKAMLSSASVIIIPSRRQRHRSLTNATRQRLLGGMYGVTAEFEKVDDENRVRGPELAVVGNHSGLIKGY